MPNGAMGARRAVRGKQQQWGRNDGNGYSYTPERKVDHSWAETPERGDYTPDKRYRTPEVRIVRDKNYDAIDEGAASVSLSARQFWEVNEAGLRELGLESHRQVTATIEKDAQGARFTFTLPIPPISIGLKQQLATCYKKAYHRHRRVLIIINNASEQDPVDKLKLLTGLGIGSVNVVYEAKTDSVDVTSPFVPPAVNSSIESLIKRCGLRAGSVSMRAVSALLAIPVEAAIHAISNIGPEAEGRLADALYDAATRHPAFTPPETRTASVTPITVTAAAAAGFTASDVSAYHLPLLVDITRQCGPILKWSTEANGCAKFEFTTAAAADRSRSVVMVCGQTAQMYPAAAITNGAVLLDETRSTIDKAIASGSRPTIYPASTTTTTTTTTTKSGRTALGVLQSNPNVASLLPMKREIPPMPDLTPMSSNTSEASTPADTPATPPTAAEAIKLPPLFDIDQPQPSSGASKLVSELMEHAGAIRLQQQQQQQQQPQPQPHQYQRQYQAPHQYQHMQHQHPQMQPHAAEPHSLSSLPVNPAHPVVHSGMASTAPPPPGASPPCEPPVPVMSHRQRPHALPVPLPQPHAAHAVHQPHPSHTPLCPTTTHPLSIVDDCNNVTIFNVMQTGSTLKLVWSGGKDGHTVVRKIALRIGLTGPELIVGTSSVTLEWKGIRSLTVRLKEMCEKVGNVQCDLEYVTSNNFSDEDLEAMWKKSTKTRDFGTVKRVSYDPYARSPQKEQRSSYTDPPVPQTTYVPPAAPAAVPAEPSPAKKRLNVNALPFVPQCHAENTATAVEEPRTPKRSESEQRVSRFDEPTMFRFTCGDSSEHPVLVSPRFEAKQTRTLKNSETVYVTEILAAGNLTWARVGEEEWSLIGKNDAIYLNMCSQ